MTNALTIICFLGCLTAAAFLAYTLLNLDALGIGLFHPRVLVEFGLVVLFGLFGLITLFLA